MSIPNIFIQYLIGTLSPDFWIFENIEDVLSTDYMTEATSALLEALFEESSSDDMGLSEFGYFMSVINSQTQDPLTAEQLDSYIENLTS